MSFVSTVVLSMAGLFLAMLGVWEVGRRLGLARIARDPQGLPTAAASMVGDVSGFEYFQVPIPEVAPGTGFDQFPGSPAADTTCEWPTTSLHVRTATPTRSTARLRP